MVEYLTNSGKEAIRQLYYQLQVKKKKLTEKGVDIGSYEYQAIQQREIALDTLFNQLITMPSEKLTDKDMTSYYVYLAQAHKVPTFNKILNEPKLTKEGLNKALDLYKEALIATAAAWHDGVFTYLPHTDNISDVEPCTINYNFLERQQGFKIALDALDINPQAVRNIEEKVRNGVYALEIDPSGGNYYVELTYYDKE